MYLEVESTWLGDWLLVRVSEWDEWLQVFYRSHWMDGEGSCLEGRTEGVHAGGMNSLLTQSFLPVSALS